MNSLESNDGMERWSGLLDWSTGVEYWNGVLDWSATPTNRRFAAMATTLDATKLA